MPDKESLRTAWCKKLSDIQPAFPWGLTAERLRSLPFYRAAATVFATPDAALHQARINCLIDGKNLVMPSPSLREGFYLLPAHSLSFKKIAMAVTYKGLAKYGQLLKNTNMQELSVRLLLTDSLAVDREGGRLGSGRGFFDLSCGLLHDLGGLHRDWDTWTLVMETQISRELLPQEPWDIRVAGAVTPTGIYSFEPAQQKVGVYWDALSLDRIRRIDPLWKLYSSKRPKL